MVSLAAITWLQIYRTAWHVIDFLQLTAYLFPQTACVLVVVYIKICLALDDAVFDFIIAGGGTSGCVIANRLTENKSFRVLLIEAGGDPPVESVEYSLPLLLQGTVVDWNFTIESEKNLEQCHQSSYNAIPSGKMLGGSSSFNYESYARGNRRDYNRWAAISNSTRWSQNNVLRYFIKSERLEDDGIRNSPDGVYHGYEGYLGVTTTNKRGQRGTYGYLKGFKQLGYNVGVDLNGNASLGVAYLMLTFAGGRRQSSAYSFITPAKDRPNLYVLKNTCVTKVIFDNNKNAIGVIALNNESNKMITVKARKEVIVAAGTFNSPKILMQSGIGPKKDLKSKGIDVVVELPVGENLTNHPASILVINLDKSKSTPPPKNFKEYVLPGTYGYITMNESQEQPDYEVQSYYLDSAYINLQYCADYYKFNYSICDAMYDASKGRNILVNVVSNLSPVSRGEVKLRSSDPKDPPLIYTRLLSKDIDSENLAKYVKDVARLLKTPYFKKIGAELVDLAPQCNDFKKDSLEYYKCYVSCILVARDRHCCTCAMGSVVDGRLRVYGVGRLRVADASVMPTIPSSDITAPTIMIGEMAADMIKEDHK